jgi:putative ABC transport system substrate-binding protein
VIGLLSGCSPATDAPLTAVTRQGLNEIGFVEGRNVAIDYRWADGQYDRLPGLAADLVRREVSVVVTIGGEPSAPAAKIATATIPIVFIGGDPVKSGLVTNLHRPGGNITAASFVRPPLALPSGVRRHSSRLTMRLSVPASALACEGSGPTL